MRAVKRRWGLTFVVVTSLHTPFMCVARSTAKFEASEAPFPLQLITHTRHIDDLFPRSIRTAVKIGEAYRDVSPEHRSLGVPDPLPRLTVCIMRQNLASVN